MFQLLRSTGLWTLALHVGIKQHSPAAVAVSRQEIDAQYSWYPAGSFRDFTGCGELDLHLHQRFVHHVSRLGRCLCFICSAKCTVIDVRTAIDAQELGRRGLYCTVQ